MLKFCKTNLLVQKQVLWTDTTMDDGRLYRVISPVDNQVAAKMCVIYFKPAVWTLSDVLYSLVV